MIRPAPVLFVVALGAGSLGGCATYETVAGAPSRRLPIEAHAAPAAAGDTLVVLYSGDGGSAGGARIIARALAEQGIPAVGVDSLAYFWRGPSAAAAAADLAALVARYGKAWGRPRVVLVGYSFGAAALPAITRRLPPDVLARVRAEVLIGPPGYVQLRFWPHSWINWRPPWARPLAPDVAALGGLRVVCVYGERDRLAACPRLPPSQVLVRRVPGGHTFDGRYDAVTAIIAAEASGGR